MRDVFLKFEDHGEALAVLNAVGVTEPLAYRDAGLPDGMLALKPVGADCDGLVYAQTGETATIGDGADCPVMALVTGFHVNIRMEDDVTLPAELAVHALAPEPATPAERFA